MEKDRSPRWRRDFPIRWENDHYVSRRELAKFLTLGSGLLVGANALIALVGRFRRKPAPPARRIAAAGQLGPGESLLFRYPTDEDPCILVRRRDGQLVAYSQVCTHLSCAEVHRADTDSLLCPCHLGSFSCAEGVPTAGPPTRRLPRIRVESRGDELWAVGVDV
jgi:nitrite reductase/ring-hydroxylating ferredoxin subunit